MLSISKRVFLFVGMVVGAGFATGRELMLYFYDKSILTIVLSGVLMGVVFAVFCVARERNVYHYMQCTLIGKILDIVVIMSVIGGFIVMTSGAEELLIDVFSVRYLGIITGIIAGVIAILGLGGIEYANLVIVPILLVLIIVVTGGKVAVLGHTHSIISSLTYVGLNMLGAGYLILTSGERATPREIAISSVLVACIFSLILVIMVSGISVYHLASMPLYTLSLMRGYGLQGGLIIYLSILSTLIGNAKVIYDRARSITDSRIIGFGVIAILSIMGKMIDFSSAVGVVYSIEGIVGSLFIVYIVLKCFTAHRVLASSLKCSNTKL